MRRILLAAVAVLAAISCSDELATRSPPSSTTSTTQETMVSGFGECAGSDVLVRAAVAGVDDTLHLTWETDGLPTNHAYYVMFPGRAQIGLESDGTRFVFDLSTSQNRYLQSAYADDRGVASLVIPASVLPDDMAGSWTATVTNNDGRDLDECSSTVEP
jgi:hypothetical protein